MMSGDTSRDSGVNGRAIFEPRAWLQRPHSSCDPILSTSSSISLRAGQAGDNTQGASAGAAAVLSTQWCLERLQLRMPTGLDATMSSGHAGNGQPPPSLGPAALLPETTELIRRKV